MIVRLIYYDTENECKISHLHNVRLILMVSVADQTYLSTLSIY